MIKPDDRNDDEHLDQGKARFGPPVDVAASR